MKPLICLFDSYSFIIFIRADYNSRQLNSYFYGWWNWQAEFHSLGTNALEKGTNASSFSYGLKWQGSQWSPALVANQFTEGKVMKYEKDILCIKVWFGRLLLTDLPLLILVLTLKLGSGATVKRLDLELYNSLLI